LSPWCSSAGALTLGLLYGLGIQGVLNSKLKNAAKYLMQASIVFVGLAVDPEKVIAAGQSGIFLTFISLVGILTAGFLLGHYLGIQPRVTTLISAGTGICGGSAIAAMGPIIKASGEEMSVALATVFSLNAAALFIFPWLGHAFHLSAEQFGYFAAIGIHDTSSVVGAAAQFDPASLATAVTVKLARALWIIPLMFATAGFLKFRSKNQAQSSQITIPWFIFIYLLAVVFHYYLPGLVTLYEGADAVGKAGLKGAIFFIGAQMTRKAIHQVGKKALLMGIILWALAALSILIPIKYLAE
jgi:uncharacterized integral membrane protein (TIGR00698 family)